MPISQQSLRLNLSGPWPLAVKPCSKRGTPQGSGRSGLREVSLAANILAMPPALMNSPSIANGGWHFAWAERFNPINIANCRICGAASLRSPFISQGAIRDLDGRALGEMRPGSWSK